MNTSKNTIMNENPQTAARLTALFAVLYSVTMTPLKAAAKAVGLTMKNPDNGRKNATTTDQFREATIRTLELTMGATMAFRAPILPNLFGSGVTMWQFKQDSKKLLGQVLARFALSPRGVGYSGKVGSKGFKQGRRSWAGQTVNWIRASWADKTNRCTATVEERKANSVAALEDGLRWCCSTCLKWFDNCDNINPNNIAPSCCGEVKAAWRYGEQSARYEPFVYVLGLVLGKWSLRRFAFSTNDGDNGGCIAANPYYGSHLVGRVAGSATFKRLFGSQHVDFRIMATMMQDVEGQLWRMWVAIPCDKSGDIMNALHISGMTRSDALKMERTHDLFAKRDGFVEALVGEINRKGGKAYSHKPMKDEASLRLALRSIK